MAPELTQLDVERLASGVSKTLHGLSDHLGDFHKLLETPPQVIIPINGSGMSYYHFLISCDFCRLRCWD